MLFCKYYFFLCIIIITMPGRVKRSKRNRSSRKSNRKVSRGRKRDVKRRTKRSVRRGRKQNVKRRSRRRSLRGGMMGGPRRRGEESARDWLERMEFAVAGRPSRQEAHSLSDDDDNMREHQRQLRLLARPLSPDTALPQAYEVTTEEQNCERMWPVCERLLSECKDNLEQNEQDLNLCRNDLRTAKARVIEQRKELEQKEKEVVELSAELEKRPELKKRDPSPQSSKRPPWR
jgi:hypothetical protein